MKRFLAATAVTVCLGASAVYASSALTIRPTDMTDGETKVLTDDDRTITVRRDGDKLRVEIDKAGKTESLTIVRDGDSIRIERGDGARTFLFAPGSGDARRRIIIDGTPLDLDHPRFRIPRDGSGLRERSDQDRAPRPDDDRAPRPDDDRVPRFHRMPRGETLPRLRPQSWFVCPKDHTMLRVPEDAEGKEFKCPVDGTVMEQRKNNSFYFELSDDDGHGC